MLTITREQGTSGREEFDLKVSEPGTGWRSYHVRAEDLKTATLFVDHYFAGHGPDRVRHCPGCRTSVRGKKG